MIAFNTVEKKPNTKLSTIAILSKTALPFPPFPTFPGSLVYLELTMSWTYSSSPTVQIIGLSH